MKRHLVLIVIAIAVSLSACMKANVDTTTTTGGTTVAPPLTPAQAARQAVVDDSLINVYLVKNKITAVKDPSGVYYTIIASGTGTNPTVNSTIQVSYTGSTLDGAIFSQNPSAVLSLSTLIQGWQIGVPLIKPGGVIILYIPSALGYSNNAVGSVPANSVLVFQIALIATT